VNKATAINGISLKPQSKSAELLYDESISRTFSVTWIRKRREEGKRRKKGTGYFFCINGIRVETDLLFQEKTACPFFM
jgi:hypothetical protein